MAERIFKVRVGGNRAKKISKEDIEKAIVRYTKAICNVRKIDEPEG